MGRMAGFVFVLHTVVLVACESSPTAPSVWASADVQAQLLATNLNHATAGSRGRLTRWRVPIEVNTNGIARANEALASVERWSDRVIRFTRVGANPANGLVFVEGGGRDFDRGCANILNAPPFEGPTFAPRWDGSSALVGAYVVHLGSEQCDDATKGRYETAYAEHVLAHALGIFDHFSGFTGPEGLVDAHAFAVLYNLYANPVGAAAQDLVVWPGAPR